MSKQLDPDHPNNQLYRAKRSLDHIHAEPSQTLYRGVPLHRFDREDLEAIITLLIRRMCDIEAAARDVYHDL
jgi:hypothetical protein